MIITDESKLRVKCSDVALDEVDDLRKHLEEELLKSAQRGFPGIGLAAPQIGIPKRMAIIRVSPNHSVDLVNCKIKEGADLAPFNGEGCLSFPNKYMKTMRYGEIYVTENAVAPYEFIATRLTAVAIQHECLPRRALIDTEDGPKSIGELVDSKYSGNVWCILDGKLILSKVVGWSKKKNQDKKWVKAKISGVGPYKNLVCTADHHCAIVNDILLNPTVSFVPARDLKGKYIVRKSNQRKKNPESGLYSKNQISVIIGSLLGDACIGKRGSVIVSHGRSQDQYANHLAAILGGCVKRGYSGFLKSKSNFVVHSSLTEQTKLLRSLFYTPKKTVPSFIADLVDPISLAYWYMDDGCLIGGRFAQIHTEGFELSDVLKLSDMLIKKFGVINSVYNRMVRGKKRYYLYLPKEGSKVFFEIIHRYVPDFMQYKLPNSYKGQSLSFDTERLPFSARFVNEVKGVVKESLLYDLKVYHHSFFADGYLVHNCDHLEGRLLPDLAIE